LVFGRKRPPPGGWGTPRKNSVPNNPPKKHTQKNLTF